jgi:hypothetical protein
VVVAVIARSVALGIAILFVLGIAHKIGVIARKRAATVPLLHRSAFLARHADVVVICAAVAEGAAVVVLVTRPQWGLAIASLLILGYLTQIRHLRRDESCHCFGEVLGTGSRKSAQLRNAGLLAVCLLAEMGYLAGVVSAAGLTPEVLGATLVVCGVPLAIQALRWQEAYARGSLSGGIAE